MWPPITTRSGTPGRRRRGRGRPAGLRGPQRPGVPDLGQERDAEPHAFGQQRAVKGGGWAAAAPVARARSAAPAGPAPVPPGAVQRIAGTGWRRSTEANPTNRSGRLATDAATSSLLISGPPGPYQAQISARSTHSAAVRQPRVARPLRSVVRGGPFQGWTCVVRPERLRPGRLMAR